MKKALMIALLILLYPVVALAAVYVYKVSFICQVHVEPGTPGLSIAPMVYVFDDMAAGGWSANQMMTVQNIGNETITGLYFEMVGPEGITFYTWTPPVMPLAPGDQISFPVCLRAEETVATGDYTINGTVVGQR